MVRLGLVRAVALLGLTSTSLRAAAEDVTSTEENSDADAGETPVQIHGFVSQGALLSSANNYLAQTERGSFEFTEGALTVLKQVGDKLRIGVQLFARDLGPVGNYNAKFDWFSLDYRWQDWFGIRAGRVKIPYGLFNEFVDIDAAQPVVLLPQAVYPTLKRDILLGQNGVEAYGYLPLGAGGGALAYRAYIGALYVPPPDATGPFTLESNEVPAVAGGRLLWEAPLAGLRLGGGALITRLEQRLRDAAGTEYNLRQDVHLWFASAEYLAGAYQLVAEYTRWYGDFESDSAAIPGEEHIEERAYGLAGYRWSPRIQTTAYYSIFYPDVDDRVGREQRQHDAALAVRFDLGPHWLLKVEGHFLRGTAALDPALNANTPLTELDNQWWLLAAKTTAYF